MDVRKINVLMGLDLSKMDEALIRYIKVATGYYPLAHFTLLHNIKLDELPNNYKTPEMLQKIREEIEKRIEDMVQNSGVDITDCHISVQAERFSEHAFLKIGKKAGANLVILGNKQHLAGNGGLSQKLIRMWQVATLLVPETFNPKPQKIVRAIDFSRYTAVINRVTRHILARNEFNISRAEAVFVSKSSWQFFPGPGSADVEKMVKENSEQARKRWKKEFPEEDGLTVLPVSRKSISATLSEFVDETETDLLIMGVLGASSLTGLFMGSVSSDLIRMPTNSGILLIKRQVEDGQA